MPCCRKMSRGSATWSAPCSPPSSSQPSQVSTDYMGYKMNTDFVYNYHSQFLTSFESPHEWTEIPKMSIYTDNISILKGVNIFWYLLNYQRIQRHYNNRYLFKSGPDESMIHQKYSALMSNQSIPVDSNPNFMLKFKFSE